MRCSLEEERAPGGWSPRPGQNDHRVVIHTQLEGTSSKLKDAAITGSRPLPGGGQHIKSDLQINILSHTIKPPELLAPLGCLSSSQGPSKKDLTLCNPQLGLQSQRFPKCKNSSGQKLVTKPSKRTPLCVAVPEEQNCDPPQHSAACPLPTTR